MLYFTLFSPSSCTKAHNKEIPKLHLKIVEIQQNMKIQEHSSSPTHEFSFTTLLGSSTTNLESQPPPSAIDLTPADQIFFQGQLLPLQLPSTNSLDDFALPIDNRKRMDSCICNECDNSTRGYSFNSYEFNARNGDFSSKERAKSKSFSLLRLGRRQKEDEEVHDEKNKKKAKFDMGLFLKRYMRIFSKESREDIQLRKQPYTFSGNLSLREKRMSRREHSAPTSVRTSPSDSGILMKDSRKTLHHSSDSSMEELQAAIQAAIAHCKNSIAAEEKLGS